MRLRKMHGLVAAVAALALMVGVGTALAATAGGGLKQEAARISARTSFDVAVARSLGTTSAKVQAAVKAAAVARIDAALAADEITTAEAATLKEALEGGNFPGMRLATAAGVAKQLDTTVAKLNTAVGDARKAQALARVDAALEAGDITEKYAAELKEKIDAATFPGFGEGGMGSHGGHRGHHGLGALGGLGSGFGPGHGFSLQRA